MTSQIDATKPIAGTPTTASVRANFATAANEITALQTATTGTPFLPLAGGTMTGPMYLAGDPTDPRMPATKSYVDAGGAGGGGGISEAPTDGQLYGRETGAWVPALPIAGGTLTGALHAPSGTLAAPSLTLGGTDTGLVRSGANLVVSLQGVVSLTFTPTALDMSSHPIINLVDPTNAQDSATKHYVDARAWLEAPNDANTYGRSALAWAKVVPITPRGNIALNIAEPANIAIPASQGVQFLGWGASISNIGFNCYYDGGAWRYLTTGYAAILTTNQSNGATYLGTFATGTAGSQGTGYLPALSIDHAGNAVLAGGLTATGNVNINSGGLTVASSTYPSYANNPNFSINSTGTSDSIQFINGTALMYDHTAQLLCWITGSNTHAALEAGGVLRVAGGDRGVCTMDNSYLTVAGNQTFNSGGNIIINGGSRGGFIAEFYWGAARAVYFDTSGNGSFTGACYATSYPGPSDARIKKNVEPWTARGLADVIELQPVSFRYNGEGGTNDDGITHYGVVAQDAQACLPEAVHIMPANGPTLRDTAPEIEDQLAFDNGTLTMAMLNAIKELATRVATLEATRA